MAVVQVSVVPIGTGSPSVSRDVARCVDILEESGLLFELNPMATVVEGELRAILETVVRMHEATFDGGAARVLTTVTIDDRRDKPLTMSGKIEAVRRRRGR